jgi:riboflavin biosynthesis pyrimidine reductase
MDIYADLKFPEAPKDRPYTFINMIATIDGKTVSGDRGESVAGLGSKVDQELMDRIESASDAVLLGAQTLRATSKRWDPKSPVRVAVTNSGDVPFDAAFFTGPSSQAYVASSAKSMFDVPEGIAKIVAGKKEVEAAMLSKYLREELDIHLLHILGGSEINALFLKEDLVDELFLTIAPKLKLGRDLPTYAGGEPFPKDRLPEFEIVEHHVVGSEVFLRYRRKR